jgi:hypothetical protein
VQGQRPGQGGPGGQGDHGHGRPGKQAAGTAPGGRTGCRAGHRGGGHMLGQAGGSLAMAVR